MKKLLYILAACLTAAVLVTGCGDSGTDGKKPATGKKEAEKIFISLATGGTAGTYYPLGVAIAEILNKTIPGMNVSAQSTGASVANLNFLKDGKVDLAFIQNDITYYAANGIEMFENKKVENLRGMTTLYPETVQIIAREDTGIKTISEIRGKRVAVGAAGSGTEANARQILAVYGITYKDIKVQYLSFDEAAKGIKEGNIDVGFVTAGFPTAAIQDLAAQHKLTLLSVDTAKADELIKKYPFYTKNTIPAGTYNQDGDIAAVAVSAMLVSTSKLSDDLGYKITKALYTNLDRIKASHPVGVLITKETAKAGMPISFNAGAEKYLDEK